MIPAIHTSVAVGERIDVDLDRVLEEAVEVDRACPSLPSAATRLEVVGEAVDAVDDLHRAAAEDVARTDEQREPDVSALRSSASCGDVAVAYGGAL